MELYEVACWQHLPSLGKPLQARLRLETIHLLTLISEGKSLGFHLIKLLEITQSLPYLAQISASNQH